MKNKENIYKHVYALTGSLASGKSTALKFFSEAGAKTFSADQLIAELHTDREVISQIKENFGSYLYNSMDQLEKQKLAELIFNSPADKEKLEKILYPRLSELLASKLGALGEEQVIIYEIPLLFEQKELYKKFKGVISVIADQNLRFNRAEQNRGYSFELTKKILNNQTTDEYKSQYSDYLIYNNHGLTELKAQVENVYSQLNR